MAQFDVFKLPSRGSFPLALDVQCDELGGLGSRVVVPMAVRRRYGKPISRLNPVALVGGLEYVLIFQEMAAIPVTALRNKVGSLLSCRPDLIAALDLLFTGI